MPCSDDLDLYWRIFQLLQAVLAVAAPELIVTLS